MENLLVGSGLFYYLLLIILAIVWIFLPFAIFGTKDKLNQIIKESNRTNELLEEILNEIVGPERESGDQ